MNESDKIRVLELQLKLLKAKGSKTAKPKASKDETTAKSIQFFKEKLNATIVKSGLKVKMPVKAGFKEYSAVEFSNGKVGVILDSGIIKYAWN
jgi:hypothetical protein